MSMLLSLQKSSRIGKSATRIIERCMYQASRFNPASEATIVDLRSDTLTLPCDKMKSAMMQADLGDDVYGEDPSVNSLQENVAHVFGKAAALFVMSGSMGNLVSLMSHCSHRGDEAIVGHLSHIHLYEQGSIASLAGVHHRTIENLADGSFNLSQCRNLIRSVEDPHYPKTALIAIENTHNACGGRVLPLSFLKELHQMAQELNLPIHMDGARIMNAATALDIEVSEIARYADSISMCFSKGIGAPMGAIVVGDIAFVKRCLWHRKALGGGTRQAGMMAAAAQFGFDQARATFTADHRRAKFLAQTIFDAVSDLSRPPFTVDIAAVDSNMLFVWPQTLSATKLCERLATISNSERDALGPRCCCVVRAAPAYTGAVRLVLHRSLTDHGVELAAKKLRFVSQELSK